MHLFSTAIVTMILYQNLGGKEILIRDNDWK
jgi:hypothetical protein